MFTIRSGIPRCRKFALAMVNMSCKPSMPSISEIAIWTRAATHSSQLKLIMQQEQHQHRALTTQAANNDSEEKHLKRIYYGTLAPRMRMVKVFSLSTSLAGLAAQPILLEQGMKIGGTGMAVFLCTIGGFFTFVTPLLLHFVTKKYVTELHYNPVTEEYTATTISLILLKVKTKFRASDVKVPEVPGMFTSFLVNNRPLFVDPALFDDPEHYVRIMGYDKPIDFKLNLKPDEKKTENKEQ